MTNEQLIAGLVSSGLIDSSAGQKIKREADLADVSVEKIISEKNLIGDEGVAQVKSQMLGVPYRKVNAEEIPEDLMAVFPEETVRSYQVVPISKADNMLVCGMVNPDDVKAQEAIKFISRQMRVSLGVFLISYGDLQQVIRRYSPYKSEIEEAVKKINIKEDKGSNKVVSLDEASARSEDAPIIRIVSETIKEAVQMGASDIHFEPQQNYLRIRFRILGELKEQAQLPVALVAPVISRIKILSNIKIDENRIPQDGRFRSKVMDREIDFRVASFPTPQGEKIALRILDSATGLRTFDQLGFAGPSFEVVKEGLNKPYGMILVTGPTGSGKSTTLYALLSSLNKEGVNIVSLEDPVEYFMPGINQSQVRPEIGYDFASGLRQILRQDPDVIMVGEIRDAETAGLAVNAALTGHIVLSTLHTNNAAGVIPRLVDMKVEPYLLPSSLNIMVAQRLVSELCSNCKQEVEAIPAMQKVIAESLEGLPETINPFKPPYKIWRAEGCSVCHGKGIVGRRAIHEVLKMTPEMEEIITSGPTIQRINNEARKQGMLSMRQDGVLKALSGIVSLEEVIKESS